MIMVKVRFRGQLEPSSLFSFSLPQASGPHREDALGGDESVQPWAVLPTFEPLATVLEGAGDGLHGQRGQLPPFPAALCPGAAH